MFLRNRFLSTSSLLFNPPGDPPAGGDGKKPVADVVDQVDDTGAADDDNAGETEVEADADGDETGVEAAGDDDDDDEEDPELAALTPEAKAAAKAAIARRVAKETGWRDRQLSKLHARNRSAQEDVRAAETIASRQPGATQENLTEAQINERAKTLAGQMTAQERYDNACNDAFEKGKSAYKDKWGERLAQLPKLGGIEIADMTDIVATDQPHVVLYHLSDPETYDRVMSLPPARRRNEFVKLSLKEAPKARAATPDPKTPSSATPPVNPVGNGRRTAAGRTNIYDDKTSDDAWYAARNAERRKKFTHVD